MKTGALQPGSFRNAWVRQLAVRLPTLALAIDDALIAFVERAAAVLSVSDPPPLRPSSGEIGPNAVPVRFTISPSTLKPTHKDDVSCKQAWVSLCLADSV